MFFAILCAPIVDGNAVYFLLLPGPGGIVHKLLSGISPLCPIFTAVLTDDCKGLQAFFCAFCRKLISPKKAETHFTEGKTHFTDGKTHFTDGKTHVLKPKNITFSLVLLNLS